MLASRSWLSPLHRLHLQAARLLLLLGALILHAAALANPVATEHVTARLVAERSSIVPGETLDLALIFEIKPGWHTYWRHPGDSGDPPRLSWTLPDGVSVGAIRWPRPELIPVGPLANYGYLDRAIHLMPLVLGQHWPIGEPVRIQADVSWLVCTEECVPESARLALNLVTTAEPGPLDRTEAEAFAAARAGLPDGRLGLVSVHMQDATLTLTLPTEGLPAEPSSVLLFAGAWGLIEHAAEQTWRLDDNQLRIDLTAGPLADQVVPEGLLVVTDTAGRISSFEVGTTQGAAPAATPLGLPLALAFALLGGLILNLMPCVFPVLAMKALSLLRTLTGTSDQAKIERVRHGLAYTAGVLLFFAVLAGLLLALRAAGAALGWGFQLQYPPFVAIMVYVFFTIGLSLAGAFSIGSSLMALGGGAMGRGTLGAFATGALAALVAAPCTAPFMGAALGYAVTLSWPWALAIILSLGLGLALPLLVLSLVPGLARWLPKPGAWMETLKQALAFPMFAAAAWLVWVASVQTGSGGVALVLSGLLLLSFALWLRERTRSLEIVARRWWAVISWAGLAGALMLGVATAWLSTAPMEAHSESVGGLQSQPYSPERLSAARADPRPVFVNMTAAWCITCLVNERVALSTDEVADAFNAAGVLYLKGDWTNRDPAITAYLAKHGRNGVPLYVFYPVGGEPRVLPQILTADSVRRAIR